MIAGQNQDVIGIVLLHKLKILIDGVGRAGVPVCVLALLIRRKNRNTTDISIQIPWDTDADMLVQSQWTILGKNTYSIDAGIDTVAKWKVDDFVLSAERYGRFG